MKIALSVGFVFFCSLWTIGSFRQCSFCQSSTSYDDCQSKLKVSNCTDEDDGCFQADIKTEKGSDKTHQFSKGCLRKSLCAEYNEGKVGFCKTQEELGYTVDCNTKCCTNGDECNKDDILANTGSALIMSVMVLFSGLLLTLVNIN